MAYDRCRANDNLMTTTLMAFNRITRPSAAG